MKKRAKSINPLEKKPALKQKKKTPNQKTNNQQFLMLVGIVHYKI